jgi:hypothetical protein
MGRQWERGMTPLASTMVYGRESCDWMRMVVRHVAALLVHGTWPETSGD